MKGLLRPLLVGGLSIAIAATTLLGSSSVAFAATKPTIGSLTVPTSVNEGDKPTVTGTFTDPDSADQHTVQISWGDGSMDFYILAVGDRSFSLQKSVGYADDQPTGASDTLSMQVTLSDGSFSVNRFPFITVANVAPSVTSFSLSSTELDAGQAVTATGTFDDPGVADTHPVTVDWGDGSPKTTMNLARRVWEFTTPEHTYVAGTWTVTATIADDDGGSVEATSTVNVNRVNQPPSVVSFGVAAGTEGGDSTLSLSFADADVSDTHTVSVAWGDDSTSGPLLLESSATAYSTTHVYADNGTYQVVLTLDDSAHNSVTAAASVSPTNVAPAVGSLTLSPASVVDHQTLTVSGDFTDPGTLDTFTLTVSWGDGTSWTEPLAAGTHSFSATHSYDAARHVTVTATVEDKDHGTSSSSVDLEVSPSNHAPANLTLDASAVVEGGTTTLNVSFTDAEALDTHTVSVTWGDDSRDSVPADTTSTSLTHMYAETGTYTVAVSVTDSGGMSVTGGTTVTASNVAPSLANLVVSPSSVTEHQTLTVSGTFSDPGTADTFTVAVNWGDDSSSAPSLSGTRSFSATHEYAAAGTYVVTATVTDRDGGTGSQTASVVVTALAGSSVSELLDQMAALIRSLELDRNVERWLLRRIDELKRSFSTGDTEFCADLKVLHKVSAFASRTLSADEYAALSALAAKIEAAAQCSATAVRPNGDPAIKSPVVTSPAATDRDKSDNSDKHGKQEKLEKQTKAERKDTNRKAGRD